MSEEAKPNGEPEQPTIHVDEDWKKSVAAEKDRLKEQEEEREPASAAEARPRPSGPLPEPDVLTFMSGLFMQTLAALGAIENPVTGKRERSLDEASYMIDTIGMLKGKMQGNLSHEEEAYIQSMLTDLRMKYVQASEGDEPGRDED